MKWKFAVVAPDTIELPMDEQKRTIYTKCPECLSGFDSITISYREQEVGHDTKSYTIRYRCDTEFTAEFWDAEKSIQGVPCLLRQRTLLEQEVEKLRRQVLLT